jgi:fermentation-respiration switch protein FrsA (DUF1100 family)
MKRLIYLLLASLLIAMAVIAGASVYMLSYSLTPDPNRSDTARAYATLYQRCPDVRQWVDSVRQHRILRDTFAVMPGGERHHALFLRGDTANGRTAIVVHGYKDCAVTYLMIAKIYHQQLGYNVLLPDLHAHGLSEGSAIQMGWLDRHDVLHWAALAERMFRCEGRSSAIVMHGVSMGAATVMNVSGERLPRYIKRFVEDCGYTSVWDEFGSELKNQFGLPAFPLLYTTSLLCRLKYGWSFGEASPLKQVAKCRRPMLFIHGDADTFVPSWMVEPLYKAHPGHTPQQRKTGILKELWITKGTEHARSYDNYTDEYIQRINELTD